MARYWPNQSWKIQVFIFWILHKFLYYTNSNWVDKGFYIFRDQDSWTLGNLKDVKVKTFWNWNILDLSRTRLVKTRQEMRIPKLDQKSRFANLWGQLSWAISSVWASVHRSVCPCVPRILFFSAPHICISLPPPQVGFSVPPTCACLLTHPSPSWAFLWRGALAENETKLNKSLGYKKWIFNRKGCLISLDYYILFIVLTPSSDALGSSTKLLNWSK